MRLEATLPAMRPCRESQWGWTPEAFGFPGNQNSLVLNERGPALKVFWSRLRRDGRGEQGKKSKDSIKKEEKKLSITR